MGYEEYLDYIDRAKDNGDYILYTLDGEYHSRQNKHVLFIDKTNDLMKEMTNIFIDMEIEKHVKILVHDENIIINTHGISSNNIWPKSLNPNFTSGDLIAFYFYNGKIDDETFKKVFYKAAKKIDNNFKYHLASIHYETNDRVKGNKLLWAGYALQYLNTTKARRQEILYYTNNKR